MKSGLLDAEKFVFVEYNGVSYPDKYFAKICEVAGHFDKESIDVARDYSLHTEYSYGKRKFDTERISRYPVLQSSHKDRVPQLWKTNEWASTFADFIIDLTEGHRAPKTIEIHPPFNDYCSLNEFIDRYRIFENKIHSKYPDTLIVIENRSGATYRGGKFLIGKAKEIAALCEIIRQESINLGIVLDFPQLLTAERIDPLKFNIEKYNTAIDTLLPYNNLIKGIHIWGKKKSSTGRWVAHAGNLDTYFSCNTDIKKAFIYGIHRICDDDLQRFLVPEVNSRAEDLAVIMRDLFEWR